MTTEKILAVVEMYRKRFEQEGIPKIRMDPKRTFGSLSREEALSHAHHLLDGVVEYAQLWPRKKGKTGRHLTAVQMILSFVDWYTLEELMNHNRPD